MAAARRGDQRGNGQEQNRRADEFDFHFFSLVRESLECFHFQPIRDAFASPAMIVVEVRNQLLHETALKEARRAEQFNHQCVVESVPQLQVVFNSNGFSRRSKSAGRNALWEWIKSPLAESPTALWCERCSEPDRLREGFDLVAHKVPLKLLRCHLPAETGVESMERCIKG